MERNDRKRYFPTQFLKTTPLADIWQTIGMRRHNGIATPLSALRTEKSPAIGEFYSLFLLVDLCHAVGFDVIQLLPINDCGSLFHPYSSISSVALDPIYLSLGELPFIKKFPKVSSYLNRLKSSQRVQYVKVKKLKLAFLAEYVERFSADIKDSSSYQQFLLDNSWVQPYALFCLFKELHKQRSWLKWPLEHKNIDPLKAQHFLKKYSTKIDFYAILQYLCFTQVAAVNRYAKKNSIRLKGDIPIFVSTDSADVWYHRSLFHVDKSAGSPPDIFNYDGQSWGMPPFNWHNMEKSANSWWCERLRVAALCYDIYRIDHILGFFRVYTIGLDQKKGSFYPKNRFSWPFDGKKRLKMLCSCSDMLPVAEDLGIIPPEVAPTIKELGILSSRIVRWTLNKFDQEYVLPKDYSPLTIVSTGSHDIHSSWEWWEKFPQEVKHFCASRNWSYKKRFSADIMWDILRDCHSASSIFCINLFGEYLCLFPTLSHKASKDIRINVPGTVSNANWTYRIVPTLETILKNSSFITTLRSLTHL